LLPSVANRAVFAFALAPVAEPALAANASWLTVLAESNG
jgi:hypothetical protein